MEEQPKHKYEFEWKIENLMISTMQNRGVIRSPVFESKILFGTSWYITLVVNGRFDADHIGVYVRRMSNCHGPSTMEINFEVGILDVQGIERHTKSTIIKDPRDPYQGHEKFVPRKEIYEDGSLLLVKDTLILSGRIWKHHPDDAVERVLLRSTLKWIKVYEHLVASPQNQCRNYTIIPDAIQCEFKVTFTWDGSDPFSISELFFPIVTIQPTSQPKGWIFMSAKISYMLRDQENFVTDGVRYFDNMYGDIWQLPPFKGPTTYDFDGSYFDLMDFMCEFTFSDSLLENQLDTVFTWRHDVSLPSLIPPTGNVLANDLKDVLIDAPYADLHLKVGEVSIPAHRFVLSARSPIFRQVLTDSNRNRERIFGSLRSLLSRIRRRQPDETEDQLRLRYAVEDSGLTASYLNGEFILDFSDDQPGIVRKIVSFLYTDDIEGVDMDTALKLFCASDKYQIAGLKRWCVSFVRSKVDFENAWETLIAVNDLECEVLTMAVYLFIYENEEFMHRQLETLPADKRGKYVEVYCEIKEAFMPLIK